MLYASSWLLTGFASDFPIFFSSRVMDIILTDRYVVAIMKVCSNLMSSLPLPLLVQIIHLCACRSSWAKLHAQAIPGCQ